MSKCLICNTDLVAANESDEHIIQNALGGTLRSKKLICKDCNSNFGADCDAQLAEDLKVFANLLNIKRDRGQVQSLQTTTPSRAYTIHPGGKPVIVKPSINIEEKNGLTQLRIEARDRKQAREILEGLKRKYPDINVEKILNQIEYKREYVKDFIKLDFSFGGQDSFRSLLKMVFFLLKHKRPDIVFDTLRIVAFLKNETNYREIYFYYPDADVVVKPDKFIYHSVLIKSYPEQRLLLGFVELYNAVSFVMVLSDNFADTFQESYVFDVINRIEVTNPILNFPNIDRAFLDNLFDNKPPVSDKVTAKFEAFLKLALERQEEAHRSELIERAMQNSLKKHPEGVPITQKMLDEFIEALMVELTPWLIRNLKE